MFEPIPGDLPRKELMESASTARLHHGIEKCDVYFKYTCVHCGNRCTFTEPNALYESGECDHCGKFTAVHHGGYLLTLRLKKRRPLV